MVEDVVLRWLIGLLLAFAGGLGLIMLTAILYWLFDETKDFIRDVTGRQPYTIVTILGVIIIVTIIVVVPYLLGGIAMPIGTGR